MTALTVIIPALNAEASLSRTLGAIEDARTIVVDGGSQDRTVELAQALGACVIGSPRGRGIQLGTGAARAATGWLLFLHADTVLEAGWRAEAEAFMIAPDNLARAAVFRFALDDASQQARRLERLVAWRNRTLGLPYGDQGLLIHRTLYARLGGYRPLPIMEDVDIMRRIGRSRLTYLRARAVTSAARWRREGWWLRSGRNLLCIAMYFAWLPPGLIARVYGR